MSKINQIVENVYVADIKPGLQVSFELTTEVPKFEPIDANYAKPKEISRQVAKNMNLKFASWGKDNKLPNHIMKMVLNNNLAPGSLDTKDQITLGDQFIFYYNRFENGKKIPTPFLDPELDDWLEMIQANEYAEEAVIDFDWLANFWAQLTFGKKGGKYQDKIVRINTVEAIDVRCAVMGKSKKVEYYGVADWADARTKEVAVYPAYNPDWELEKMPRTFLMHMKKKTIGNPYYPLPNYIGAQHWIRHANKIPIWKTNNMDNAVNIKYHIQAPEKYFQTLYPESKGYSAEDRRKKFEEKVTEFADALSGAENVGKAIATQIMIDPQTGKELPGWKFEPIKNEIDHEAYSKDYEDSNSAILSAIAVDPSLSGVLVVGKMGAGSGSEKRLAYEFHAKVKTRYARRLLLRPIQTAMAINKFDRRNVEGEERKIYIGIQDVDFTTLDKNPTGSQKVL